jgi:tRNA-splicing ligase RtcB (3'-phosphate/5'-hydroxy nucleic acid ligase)
MKWVYNKDTKIPIKSWCENVDENAMEQAKNLANHPVVYRHVALMPDCHVGYGMPIGGVIACENAVIPNAVGVDIGCGMGAVETDYPASKIKKIKKIRKLLDIVKTNVPAGEGHYHKAKQEWEGFEEFLDSIEGELPPWYNKNGWNLDAKNLGTLGGGNHFIELQKSESGNIWLMLHSGSRNLGYRIANYYQNLASTLNKKWHSAIPSKHLAFLNTNDEGRDYIRDMNFALKYAKESRFRMMEMFKDAVFDVLGELNFLQEINIHHNYANIENHFGRNLWIHRKGATSAKAGEKGIIPGSMGTSSYIVEGLGNVESFKSCSHGAGRVLGRKDACHKLNIEKCDKAMEGIVFDRWNKIKGRGKGKKEKLMDLSEAPFAYKNIDEVIEAELDLIKPIVKLQPLGVVKG